MTKNEEIEALVASLIEKKGFELYSQDFKKEGSDWVLRLFVDNATRNITLDECAEISNYIGEQLDNTPLPEMPPYRLEVSSPGLDRLLRNDADFQWARGKTLKVKFTSDENKKETIEGKLNSFDSETLNLIMDKKQNKSIKRAAIESARRVMIFSELIDKNDN